MALEDVIKNSGKKHRLTLNDKTFTFEPLNVLEQVSIIGVCASGMRRMFTIKEDGTPEINPLGAVIELGDLPDDKRDKIFYLAMSKCSYITPEGIEAPLLANGKITLEWIERDGYLIALVMEFLRLAQGNFSQGVAMFMDHVQKEVETPGLSGS